MAMKYVKLFENWLLTEGDQVTEFDASKPDMWPVKETTVKNAVKTGLSEKFLQSIFRRALKEENREFLKVSEAYVEEVKTFQFPVSGIFANERKDDASLAKLNNAIARLEWDIKQEAYTRSGKEQKDWNLLDVKTTSAPEIKKIIEKYYIGLTNAGNKKSEWMNRQDTKDMYKSMGAKKQEFIDFCTKTLLPKLEARVKVAESRQDRFIDFYWKNDQIFTVYVEKELGGGIDETKPIMDYPCIDINCFGIEQYLPIPKPVEGKEEVEVEPEENPLYNLLKAGDINALNFKDIKLTFGMIMTWLNKWQNGESYLPALSNTGAKQYPEWVATIFDAEEREYLADFEPTSFTLAGTKFNLANTKSAGTVVPLLALNKVYGTVGFAFNSSEITKDGQKSLGSDVLWKILSKADKSIIIVGNADGIGSDKVNDALSKDRAKKVLEVLQSDKRASRLKPISIRGDGKRNPLVDDNKGMDKKNAALNRRVEIIIDGKPASDVLKGQL